jgi:putative salt-induced outer membrane protein YdiY
MLILRVLIPVFLGFFASTALAAGEPWSDDFSPPPGKDSWIQLDTDEWIKGDIIALYDETLVFDSDHFGDLNVDLEDIRNVYGRGSFAVTFANGRPVRGQLQIREATVVIVTAEQRYEGSRADLVSITPAAERERDRWMGDIGFGLDIQQGNTDIADLSIDIGFQRRTPVSRFTLDYLANMNETDGVRITDSHRINTGLDRFTGRRLYWRPFSAQYFKDELTNIRHQGTLDTGLGYHLIDTNRVTWDLQAGVGYNYLQYVSVADDIADDNETSPVGTFSSELEIEVTSWMDYELLINMTFLNEKSGKYQHHIVSALSTDLIGDIDLDFSTIWDRTEIPQENADGTTPSQDDFRFMISLSYDF